MLHHLIGSELASFIDDFFAAGGVIRSVEFRTADIFVHGDAAYELGQYEETGQVGIQEPEQALAVLEAMGSSGETSPKALRLKAWLYKRLDQHDAAYLTMLEAHRQWATADAARIAAR